MNWGKGDPGPRFSEALCPGRASIHDSGLGERREPPSLSHAHQQVPEGKMRTAVSSSLGEGALYSWLYQFGVGFLVYELVGRRKKGVGLGSRTTESHYSYQIIIDFSCVNFSSLAVFLVSFPEF